MASSAYNQAGTQLQPPSRMTQVQSQISRQSDLVGQLAELTKTLETKISGILRSTSPVGQGKSTEPKMALVGHATAICNQNDQLEDIISHLSDILDRIEL